MATPPGRNPLRQVLDEAPHQPRRPFQLVGEIFSELSKVTWPTRQETTRLTVLVVSVAVTIGIILGLWDFGFNRLVGNLLS